MDQHVRISMAKASVRGRTAYILCAAFLLLGQPNETSPLGLGLNLVRAMWKPHGHFDAVFLKTFICSGQTTCSTARERWPLTPIYLIPHQILCDLRTLTGLRVVQRLYSICSFLTTSIKDRRPHLPSAFQNGYELSERTCYG